MNSVAATLPQTLLEISGAAYPAGRLADSAIVIVDAQASTSTDVCRFRASIPP